MQAKRKRHLSSQETSHQNIEQQDQERNHNSLKLDIYGDEQVEHVNLQNSVKLFYVNFNYNNSLTVI